MSSNRPQGSFDSTMTVYDSNGNVVAFNDDSFQDQDSTIVDLTLPKPGTYYVEVTPFSNPGETTNQTGAYELFLYTFATDGDPPAGDTMYAGSGNDTIIGGAGDDTIAALPPKDTIIFGSGTAAVANKAPYLNVTAGPDQPVSEGDSVTLTGSFIDPFDSDTHTYDWHVVAPSGQTIPDGTGPTFTFSPGNSRHVHRHLHRPRPERRFAKHRCHGYVAVTGPLINRAGHPGPCRLRPCCHVHRHGDGLWFADGHSDVLLGAVNPADRIGTGTLAMVGALDQASVSISTLSVNGGPYTITAVYSGDSNNNGSTSNAVSQMITPAPLTITAINATMTYGASLPALSVSYAGLVNGDTPATFAASPNTAPTITTVPASSHAGNYAITASGAFDPNYTIGYAAGTLTVNKFAFTYAIHNDSQTYGTKANLAIDLPGTISTGVNNQNLSIAYSSSGDTSTAHVGNYAITGTLSSGSGQTSDYSVTLTSGTLTVNPATLTITANNDSKTYGTLKTFSGYGIQRRSAWSPPTATRSPA